MVFCVCVCSAFSLVQSPLHVLSVLSVISCVCVVHGVLSVTCAMNLCALLCLHVYVHVHNSDCLYECLSVRTHADNRKLRIRLSVHAKKLLTIVLKYPVAISSSSGFVNIPSNNFPSLSRPFKSSLFVSQAALTSMKTRMYESIQTPGKGQKPTISPQPKKKSSKNSSPPPRS